MTTHTRFCARSRSALVSYPFEWSFGQQFLAPLALMSGKDIRLGLALSPLPNRSYLNIGPLMHLLRRARHAFRVASLLYAILQ